VGPTIDILLEPVDHAESRHLYVCSRGVVYTSDAHPCLRHGGENGYLQGVSRSMMPSAQG